MMRHVILFSLALIVASPCFGQSSSPFQSVPAPSAPAPVAKPRPARPPASEPDAAPAEPVGPTDNVTAEEAKHRCDHAHELTGQNAEELRWCRKAADLGYADAWWYLGMASEHGEGVPKDEAEALRLYRKAADAGSHYGMMFLADHYKQSAPEDYAQAVLWYRRAFAVSSKDFVAPTDIALLYERGGPGLPQDMTQARYWYQLAAQLGSNVAKTWVAEH